MAYSRLVLAILGAGAFTFSAVAGDVACLPFSKLPVAFKNELSLGDQAKIRFLPFEFPVNGAAKKGFVLQDQDSCGLRGNCDSFVYLAAPADPGGKACYRQVLEFNGSWAGVQKASGRKPASVWVDGRGFEFTEKTYRFEEKLAVSTTRKKK